MKMSIYKGVNFNKSIITKSNFDFSNFTNCKFKKSRILKSFLGAIFKNCDFSNSKMKKVILESKMIYVNFSNSSIIDSTFVLDTANNLNFRNTNLTNSTFIISRVNKLNFCNSNLTNVWFRNAKSCKIVFKNVTFKNADMTGTKIDHKYYNYLKKQGVRNFDKIRWQ